MPGRARFAPPGRSGRTELTDDELALLDVTFDKVGTWDLMLRLLTSPGFGEAFNTQNVPDCPPSRRPALVSSMVDRGIFRTTRRRGELYLGVSPAGGALWELERDVPWETYVTASERVYGDERDEAPTRVTIRAFSSHIAEAYLDALAPLGAVDSVRRWPMRVESQSRCIPWKRSRVFVLVASARWGAFEGPWRGEGWSNVDRLTELRRGGK